MDKLYQFPVWGAVLCFAFSGALKAQSVQPQTSRNKDTATANLSDFKKFSVKPAAAATSTLDLSTVTSLPFTGVDQLMNGRVTGIDVRNNSGEPGLRSLNFIRGMGIIPLTNKDLYYAQPLIVLDGIPLLPDYPGAYDLKRFDYNKPGSEISRLAGIAAHDIESLKILKDAGALAIYGPQAVNGVILITTKKPAPGKQQVNVNVYAGIATPGTQPAMSNAKFERDFRLPFYQQYAGAEEWRNFPTFLADSTDAYYFGKANWRDNYYRNAFLYGINADIRGGGSMANFRFGLGTQSEDGVADQTAFKRYNVSFGLNLLPMNNLKITTWISASFMNRDRNRYLRDRYAEIEYMPNLEFPLSPDKSYLAQYETDLSKSFDKNKANSLRGYVQGEIALGSSWLFSTRLAADYQQDFRDVFYPRALFDNTNFISNYAAVDRRLLIENRLKYLGDWGAHQLAFTLGNNLQWDSYRFEYDKGYKGSTDVIKIYKPNGASHITELLFNYLDYSKQNLISVFVDAQYTFRNKYHLMLHLRNDGSSNFKYNPWFPGYTAGAAWDMQQEEFAKSNRWLNQWTWRLSYGRIGRLYVTDNYGYGPYMTVDANWAGSQNMATVMGYSYISRSYSNGFNAYDTDWPYQNMLNAGWDISMLDNRIGIAVDAYRKDDKNQLFRIPVSHEYGFDGTYQNGVHIRNSGVEVQLSVAPVRTKDLEWNSIFRINRNHNKLVALPGVQDRLMAGGRQIRVGGPVDGYWLLDNQGIFESDDAVPENPVTGKKLSYKGIALQKGDPKWADTNGDYIIDDNDRVLMGQASAGWNGGWENNIRWKQFNLQLLFTCAWDKKVINEELAGRFDFVNRSAPDDIRSIKEQSFWTLPASYDHIPRYNPWRAIDPYQAGQSLFLENAAFVKLRSARLSYDMADRGFFQKHKFNMAQVYVAATNLFTLSGYKSGDPELTDFRGYNTGYGLPIPRSFTVGCNFNF
ncbi:SusC/RagA family TonB-linked outer membrane protein [Chitinophaga defluvii]|uniref:SusC/RagA family TonB-linked outer membrane protein n=1 Tax=Chitinophaga defluvii TaxID=3163343 RepID=A0ABV2T5Y4_9BACT